MEPLARRVSILAVILASLAAAAAPQEPKLVESIEIRVANVDVTVRDKSGNPVTGLTKDDFELLENGVRQPITNLYEVRRGPAPPSTGAAPSEPAAATEAPTELRQRKVILFVDASSLEQARKHKVLDGLDKFVEQHLRPDDETMLVVWRIGLKVVTPFTRDKAEVRRGLDAIQKSSGEGSQQMEVRRIRRDIDDLIDMASANPPVMSWPEAYSRARSAINVYSEATIGREQHLLDTLGRLTATVSAVEGKKVVVFAGEHLPERPGAELYQYAFDQFSPHIGDGRRRGQGIDMQSITGVVGNHMSSSIRDLATRASANGVTIYTIDAADTTDDFSAESEVAPDSASAFTRYANTAAALQTIASITGGVAIAHTDNYDFAFDTISRDLDSYYSLGYRPPNPDKTGTRNIVVKAKNRAYTVRSRANLAIQSSEEQMDDKVVANLYTNSIPSTWAIFVRTGTPKKDGKQVLVPVVVVMPATTLTLLPQDGNLVGGFVLYFAVSSGNGTTSEVIRKPQGVKIPPNAEAIIRAKPMTFSTELRLPPGESTLSVGVVDQISGTTGFARAEINTR